MKDHYGATITALAALMIECDIRAGGHDEGDPLGDRWEALRDDLDRVVGPRLANRPNAESLMDEAAVTAIGRCVASDHSPTSGADGPHGDVATG